MASSSTSRTPGVTFIQEDSFHKLVDAEESLRQTLPRLGDIFTNISSALGSWGEGESHDFRDHLLACSTLLTRFTSALVQFSARIEPVRHHVQYLESTTKVVDKLVHDRETMLRHAIPIEQSLAGMDPNDKETQKRVKHLSELKTQIGQLNANITAKQLQMRDFKRSTARDWTANMFGALHECSQKGSIIGEFGKLVVQEIPSEANVSRSDYNGHSRARVVLVEAEHDLGGVIFTRTFSTDRSKVVRPGGGRRHIKNAVTPTKSSRSSVKAGKRPMGQDSIITAPSLLSPSSSVDGHGQGSSPVKWVAPGGGRRHTTGKSSNRSGDPGRLFSWSLRSKSSVSSSETPSPSPSSPVDSLDSGVYSPDPARIPNIDASLRSWGVTPIAEEDRALTPSEHEMIPLAHIERASSVNYVPSLAETSTMATEGGDSVRTPSHRSYPDSEYDIEDASPSYDDGSPALPPIPPVGEFAIDFSNDEPQEAQNLTPDNRFTFNGPPPAYSSGIPHLNGDHSLSILLESSTRRPPSKQRSLSSRVNWRSLGGRE
ncbi:hypothetical protein JAAARDRAFT_60955 [Jaapia argillacea MUCL 33604]|uniref:Uncharacterized protein n=1 Tax=Jaapia argillacea MUCL 33604 TaxID=933084 RepID=A0A067PU41_9AGAM|nr:hypothetical protein JAAARDRAFT_60955 [Jaapia argillacea MUCL 33604]